MTDNRDDFSSVVKKNLAGRAGHKCSFPECGKSTAGPSLDSPEKSIQNGMAAHISAAAPGLGARRYNPSLTSEERRSIDNGIWMCPNHGNLIDKEETAYTVEDIRTWKLLAEKAARDGLEKHPRDTSTLYTKKDLSVLKKYCNVLSYSILNRLYNEPFGKRVPYDLVSAVNFILDVHNDPSYSFQNTTLSNLRDKLHSDTIAFIRHFAQQSGGHTEYYEYIDLEIVRREDPQSEEYWKKEIYKCQELAQQVSKTAMEILKIKEDAIPE